MTAAEVTNVDVFLWALHLLGGTSEYVDVEDVYVKCFELAPRRFSWRTKDLPDYKKCAKALRDAEVRVPALLVKTGDGLRRQLSAEGQRWVQEQVERLSAALAAGQGLPAPRQRPDSRALRQVASHDVFCRWKETGTATPEKWELAELLRCSTDSSLKVWRERIEVLRAAAFAAKDEEILLFLEALKRSNARWFWEGDKS